MKNKPYWIVTIIFVCFMSIGAVADILFIGPAVDAVDKLGYPEYFIRILGACKIVGFILLLSPLPVFLIRFKEWAYAGFMINLTSAFISHIAIGDTIDKVLPPVFPLILLLVSYFLYIKKEIFIQKEKLSIIENKLYWVVTVLFAFSIVLGAFLDGKDAVEGLGFPDYFFTILGFSKAIGFILLLAPLPAFLIRFKEWAYMGFMLNLPMAIISHIALMSTGEPHPPTTIPPFIPLILLIISYFLYIRKVKNESKIINSN